MNIRTIILLYFIVQVSFAQKHFEVFFDVNKEGLNKKSIDDFNTFLKANSNLEILSISGYCDRIDNNNYNKLLAQRRINSVVEFLKENLISINKNTTFNVVGEDFKQSKNQELNRKVILKYIEKKLPNKNMDNYNIEPELSVIVQNEKSSLVEKFKLAKKKEIIRLNSIRFYLDTAKIIELSKPVLEELVKILKENPNLKIEIQGHICCQFVDDLRGLSSQRAKAIYTYLIQNEIDKKRLTYKGYGVLKPIHKIPEENSKEEQDNRRVEILIIEN